MQFKYLIPKLLMRFLSLKFSKIKYPNSVYAIPKQKRAKFYTGIYESVLPLKLVYNAPKRIFWVGHIIYTPISIY